jgi:hypothetical protein
LEAINQAAITYSADQLPAIAPYLNSPDPELRAAALDGVVLLGNAAGAKLLRNAASNLTDPAEIVKFREKADYLELPSLPKEAILARIKAAKARRASSARTGTGTGTKP